MSAQNIKPEILSPVGNREMLEAAVRSGADAVYLGAKDFSARRNAQNFSAEELKEVVAYCHIRGVKVYLTLNILIKNKELSSALSLAQKAYLSGIDGIILQDIGLARLLHNALPDLKLHASTQMTVHSPSALPLLKELGFTQVVAAREMSRGALEILCRKAEALGMVVEVFVHGALCMSVSGQCLLSAFLGSRSGNRGLCAGPCRLPFAAEKGTGYDLSLKDLSLVEHLKELAELGVGSFKIEGRMKRPEYVAVATAACRSALDLEVADPILLDTLKNVFTRSGQTDGYYKNSLGRHMFGIRTKEDVLSAKTTFSYIHSLYRAERSSVAVTISAEIIKGTPISVTFSDGEHTVKLRGPLPEAALKASVGREDIAKALSKLGSTPYFAEKLDITLDEGLFIRASDLNDLRRRATELLDLERSRVPQNSVKQIEPSPSSRKTERKNQKLYIRLPSADIIPEELEGVSAVLLPIEEEPITIPEGCELVADIPRWLEDEEYIYSRLLYYKEKGATAAFCGNLAALPLALKAGLRVIGSPALNLLNLEAFETARVFGASEAAVSVETELSDIKETSIPAGIITYGHIPLMLLKNCPVKNGVGCKGCDKKQFLTDRLSTRFPVRCRKGSCELLNSLPLWMLDRPEETRIFDWTLLYFTVESKERIAEVLTAAKGQLPPDTPHTRGLYRKGTL